MNEIIYLFGIKQFECDVCLIHSLYHEMYFQLVLKSKLFPFDDKRCYESNFESELRRIKF